MFKKSRLYLSFDIETDGPSPIINNLLAIGIYAFTIEAQGPQEIFKLSYNIRPLDGHTSNARTMEFWAQHPVQWAQLQIDQLDADDVMVAISDKLRSLSSQYFFTWVAMPACFDWMFFKAYYEAAATRADLYDIGYQCFCISTTWNLYKKNHAAKLRPSPEEYKRAFFQEQTAHDALNDAINQGKFYAHLLDLF